ncbi:rhomboid family intramembrane serine protease [Enterococcus faecium]|nr:rhomboid family intramembrane serine protease [Enterococcus faecium]
MYEGHLFPNIFISIVSHISLYHLISNLLFLVVLEEALNDQYEWLTLLIVLIISGLLGSLVPFLLQSNIVSMGLSGGILDGLLYLRLHTSALIVRNIYY